MIVLYKKYSDNTGRWISTELWRSYETYHTVQHPCFICGDLHETKQAIQITDFFTGDLYEEIFPICWTCTVREYNRRQISVAYEMVLAKWLFND